MRQLLNGVVVLLILGCGGVDGMDAAERARLDSAQFAELSGRRDSALGRKADSIAALDPALELTAALVRGDLRPIGVCGYACMSVGIEAPDHALLPTDSMIIVSGTGDAVSGPGMARLNAVADTYATTYNRLLIEHLKARRSGQ